MEPNEESEQGEEIVAEETPKVLVRLLMPWGLTGFRSPAFPGVEITRAGTWVDPADVETIQSEADRIGIRIQVENTGEGDSE